MKKTYTNLQNAENILLPIFVKEVAEIKNTERELGVRPIFSAWDIVSGLQEENWLLYDRCIDFNTFKGMIGHFFYFKTVFLVIIDLAHIYRRSINVECHGSLI